MVDHDAYPLARKLRPPKGKGWPSGFSEYAVIGETNRFRYLFNSYKVEDGPPQAPGKRRIFARIEGKHGAAVALLEELPDRPL
jgi:hypothetical protein